MNLRKISLASKLGKLEEYVKTISKLQKEVDKKRFLNEEFIQRAIERSLQLGLEAVLDIADHVINEYGFEKAETYKDVILVLGKNNVIPETFAKKISPAAGFRNILVHNYVSLDANKVFEHFKKDAGDIKRFMQYIVRYISK